MALPTARSLIIILALGASIFGAPSPVRGQTEKARLLQRAQALVNQASRQYAAGDFAAALASLREAEPLAEEAGDPGLPSIRFNIARCLEQLDRPAEALAAYERYDALPDASHRKQKAFEAMRALERRVYGVLSVSCAPAGAVVEIEGLVAGMEPCPWQSGRVPPGAYAVRVTAPGYLEEVRSVQVQAGEARNVQVTLAPSPSASPSPVTAVGVAAESGGLDLPTWPLVTLGGGAAVAGVGAVFTALALDERDQAESIPPGPEQDDAVDAFETYRTVSYILYGVGGALAATGVVLFFVPGGEDDPEAARIEPTPTGLAVRF